MAKQTYISTTKDGAWTTLVTGPALVRGLFVSTPSAGEGWHQAAQINNRRLYCTERIA